MKRAILGIALLIIFAHNALGKDVALLPGLKTIEVGKTYDVFFSYSEKLTQILNKDITDKNSMIKTIIVAKTRLSEEAKESYLVVYFEGASADPMFIMYRGDTVHDTEVFSEFGLHLQISGDGSLYLSGHTNNMYNQRKKYTLKEGKFIEVIQPYYYVGVKTKLKDWLPIFSDLNQNVLVAKLPKGSSIEVLINSGEYYLVKSDYGLLGWTKIEMGDRDTNIEGIYYAGD
jgi:hypothetical protein